MTHINRGRILRDAARRHVLSITEIAERAGYTQSTFYKHIKKQDLDFNILYKYAKEMNYYFLNEIPEFKVWLEENRLITKGEKTKDCEEIIKDRDKWRDKYYSLLERYNSVLEGNSKS